MITRWCGNNNSGRNGAAWDGVQWGTRCLRIRSGPQVGQVATQPLPPGGSPPLQSGGQNQRWPTSGPGGYITPAAWGPHRGRQTQLWQQSEVENLIFWGPRNKAWISEWGDNIRNSPQVGPVAVRSGKTFVWVSNLLCKKKFLLSHLLSKKTFFY